jgi:hypothetical protein
MGGGFYCSTSRSTRAEDYGYFTKSVREIFESSELNDELNPNGLTFREARDSEDHPNSVPIIVGLDVTGSMGFIPHELVKDGLPKVMDGIIQNGIPDPQILFLGIGDHECDSSPLQVSQFESSDELLDNWLTKIYLEGGGGGNTGESYLLAWYVAARYTKTDAWEKRGKKGFLFTIGDEPNLKEFPNGSQSGLMGNGQYEDVSAAELLKEASEKYHVYHIIPEQTYAGSSQRTRDDWLQSLGDHAIFVKNKEEIPSVIARIVSETEHGNKPAGVGDTSGTESSEKSDWF